MEQQNKEWNRAPIFRQDRHAAENGEYNRMALPARGSVPVRAARTAGERL